MRGSDDVSTPTRYGVLMTIMREYGWSWADLCAAPADLVEEIATRIGAENHWTAERRNYDAKMSEAQAALNRAR